MKICIEAECPQCGAMLEVEAEAEIEKSEGEAEEKEPTVRQSVKKAMGETEED